MKYTLPFLLGGVFAFLIILAINSKKRNNCTYDERQLVGRADAFKGGFYSLLIYITASEIVSILLKKEWITPSCNLAFAISISAITFAIICIIKEAYLGLNQNAKSTIISSSIISIANIVMGILHMEEHKFVVITGNRLDLDVNFIVGTALLIVTIFFILHTTISRKSVEKYEES